MTLAPAAFILASGSPRRVELLRLLQLDFEVVPSAAPEVQHEFLSGGELAQVNAYRKARAVAKQHPDAVVLGADTVVYLDYTPLGKPRDLREARRMLETLQGRSHEVFTGVCLLHLRLHRQKLFVEQTSVSFRELSADEIDEYVQVTQPLDKAGGYGIQDHRDQLVREINGSYTNVVGLPVERLRAELDGWGDLFER